MYGSHYAVAPTYSVVPMGYCCVMPAPVEYPPSFWAAPCPLQPLEERRGPLDAFMTQPRYTPLSVIGNGTYGEVILAWDARTRHHVAIKISRAGTSYLEATRIEAALLQRLGSVTPHVVRVWHAFEEGDRCCIVMEVLHAHLAALLAPPPTHPPHTGGGGLPLSVLRSVLKQLLSSLALLHGLGYVHCDVKPDNVMIRVGPSPEACLIDLGAVRAVGDYGYHDVQSLPYRAPEVLCQQPYGAGIDVWSVGVLSVELLTGRRLFWATNTSEQRLAVLRWRKKGGAAAQLERHFGGSDRPGTSPRSTVVMKAIDLIAAMTANDPAARIGAQRALSHPFLTEF